MLYRMPLCLLVTLGQVHVLRKGNVVNVDVNPFPQKNNYLKQKDNMGSFPLPQTNTIDAPHTRIFVWETVTPNCAATQ